MKEPSDPSDPGDPRVNREPERWRIPMRLFGLGALTLASACATPRAAPPEAWWPGVVVGVMQLAEVPPDIDRQCLQLPEAEAAGARTVVLVRRRIGRSPHTRAFVLAAGEVLSVGERVRVDSDSCQIVAASVVNAKH